MRTIDRRWQNVARGLDRAEQLEGQLKTQWVPRIEEAALSRLESAQAAWRCRQEASWRQFEKQHAGWSARYSERCRHVEDQLRVWSPRFSHERERFRSRAKWGALSGLATLAILGLILALLGAPVSSYPLAAAAVLCLALGPAALSSWRLGVLRRAKPSPHHAGDPEPQPPAAEPEPTLDRGDPLPLKIRQQWCDEVSYSPRTPRPKGTHGDEGVERFWSYLGMRLPDKYVAVRDLLVRRGLDVDILVAGPTGIWLFEVKHWTGEITCRGGRWRKEKNLVRTWRLRGLRGEGHRRVRPAVAQRRESRYGDVEPQIASAR